SSRAAMNPPVRLRAWRVAASRKRDAPACGTGQPGPCAFRTAVERIVAPQAARAAMRGASEGCERIAASGGPEPRDPGVKLRGERLHVLGRGRYLADRAVGFLGHVRHALDVVRDVVGSRRLLL